MPERWVDPGGVRTLRADVCQVQGARGEMALLFGTRADGQAARLERRIVLPPALAKQLAAALAGAAPDANGTPAGITQSAASEDDAPAAARPMFRLVRTLGVGFGFEKSFKMGRESLLAERVILGVRTALAEPSALVEICRRLGMPPAHLAQFAERLPEANTVGFGFERGARGDTLKVYLEFWDRLCERLRHEPRNLDPGLLFLGFKWDAAGPGDGIVARYTCYPRLSVKGILRRLARLYGEDTPSAATAREMIQAAAARIASQDSFVYVEAEEEGNPRRSFDLNLYKAGLRISDVQPALSRLRERYSIADAAFASLLRECAAKRFGHLSGGLGRENEDFLTLYYEIEGL